MPSLSLIDNDPSDLIGIDVEIDLGFHHAIGHVTDVEFEENDDGEAIPGTGVFTVEEHLRDKTYETNQDSHFGGTSIRAAIVGREYTVYWWEALTPDGEWEQLNEKSLVRGDEPKRSVPDDATRTRVRKETYEAGADHTKQFPIRAANDGLNSVVIGRSDLQTCIAALSEGSGAIFYVEQDDKSVTRIRATIESAEPELPEFSPETASASPPEMEDSYTITGTDQDTDAGIEIEYDNKAESATLTRTVPEDSDASGDDEVGDIEAGELRGIDNHTVVEWFNISWFNEIERRVTIPDELNTSSIGYEIGTVYIDPENKFELYHASIDGEFTKNGEPINDLITVDTPMTFGRSSV